ncbi:MAG TPA: (2Fe-2S)-binding protein [Candidatus Polarisedimenticolia bacterium]|jgi:aerobic-type carbon monoxide dehydrogenase small subunit (CoxS/CutS family)|nr:(2Fe-2S)-binding protein [Candidatus Polarisedimenticolia bacterium]
MTAPDRARTSPGRGTTRREFLTGVTGALTAAAMAGGKLLGSAEEGATAKPIRGPGKTKITLEVNGRRRELSVEPRTTLLAALRDELRLTGTKSVCELGQCGACTILLGQTARYACLTLAVQADGRSVTTIEGLASPAGDLHPLQAAFVETDGLQCGFCTPGQVMAAAALLRRRPDPKPEEIRAALAGNTCRCAAYPKIFEAVALAASRLKPRP